ncbi:MAG: glycosyltransferase family 2 protein [Candidatus Methanomethylicia archaeon]
MSSCFQTSMPYVSIVIINARNIKNLESCLKSIYKTQYSNYEVLVVDCQTPKIEELAMRYNFRLIGFKNDVGPAKSHNIGFKNISINSKYIVFLDNDIKVTPHWLKRLVDVMEKDRSIGIAQACILQYDHPDKLDHSCLSIDLLGTWVSTYGLKQSSIGNRIIEIFAASSAACITRRNIYEITGGFDDDYFIYDDDTDYSWRVRLIGCKVVLVRDAIVYHKSNIEKKLNPFRVYHSTKNRLYTLFKNAELENLLIRGSIYLFLSFLAIHVSILINTQFSISIIKAVYEFMKNLRKIIIKRVYIQSMRAISDKILFSKGFLRNSIEFTVNELLQEYKYLRRKRI